MEGMGNRRVDKSVEQFTVFGGCAVANRLFGMGLNYSYLSVVDMMTAMSAAYWGDTTTICVSSEI